MPRLWAVVAIALAASAVTSAAVAADGKTLRLNWVDTTPSNRPAMTFKVASVTLTPRAWSVRATIVNRSKEPAEIVRADARAYPHQYNFAVAWFSACPPHAYSCERGINSWPSLRAAYAKPALPKELGPGESWSGVFGGPGLPPQGKLVYVTFGTFVFRLRGTALGWITNGSFKR
jgi:hypothetical protein